ncbi:MAG: ABC transporter ATP-binding protein [Gammaproteobacteria bacterium]|nr:ABC transporter ATP-binding protein [Gammaproteobacteria bacterium]
MIEIKDLMFRYKADEKLFQDLNLSLSSGTISGLLGKNGAGKTTLLRLIAGLLFPKEGSCQVNKFNPKKRLPDFLRDIYFIPEEFYVPAISIKLYVNLYSVFYPNFDHQALSEILTEFELETTKKLTTLSYGQKKKFIVAFALATNCRLLLLDEPTNGLDIPSKSQFRKLIASGLTADKTVIISTHQARDLQNILDSIIILDTGKVVFNRHVEEISAKLSFSILPSQPEAADVIYKEKTLGGYAVVEKNVHNIESEVDLELLFNAVINSQEQIQKIF